MTSGKQSTELSLTIVTVTLLGAAREIVFLRLSGRVFLSELKKKLKKVDEC